MLTSSSNICVKKTNDKCKPYQTHQIEPPRTSKYRILNLISRNTANENSIRKHKFWTRSVQTAKKLFQTLFQKRTSPTTVKAEKGNVQMAFYSFLFPYRHFMAVHEVMIFHSCFGETGYYVCPRCHRTMEREFTAFCDRCGQHLDWADYENAKIGERQSSGRFAHNGDL